MNIKIDNENWITPYIKESRLWEQLTSKIEISDLAKQVEGVQTLRGNNGYNKQGEERD